MSKLHVNQIAGFLTKRLKNFVDLADYEHHEDAGQIHKVFLTRALSALAVSSLADVELEGLCSNITDGQKDGGIDLIYFDAAERTLYLAQTKWHDDGHGSIELGDVLKFIEGVRKVLDDDVESLNEKIRARRPDIERALYDANAKFVLVLAHTGQEPLADEVSNAILSYVASQNDTSELMTLRVMRQGDLHQAVAEGVAGAPISLEVQLSGWGQIREPYFAVYGQVCAADVANWMRQFGSRLFESNLRQFLGGSVVNEDIVATLVERPNDFWYFNNGITALALDVAKKPIGGSGTDSGIFECTGFSVVNGAQTVGAIHAASDKAPDVISKAMVPVRIISSKNSPAVFSNEVTRCTNTQNAIEKRDFVALDPEQERIRQELHIEGIDYAYKAGSNVGSGPQKFDLTEATVALACAHEEVSLAVQAKREISKLWDDISKAPYKQLFNGGVAGPAIWSAVQALREVDKRLQVEAKKRQGREALICVHGNRFIQWGALRLLANGAGGIADALNPVHVEKAVGEALGRTLESVRTHFSDAYPASLFKNLAKCRVLAKSFG